MSKTILSTGTSSGFGLWYGPQARFSTTSSCVWREISVPYAHVWTVSGGKPQKFIQYTDTAKVLEAIR